MPTTTSDPTTTAPTTTISPGCPEIPQNCCEIPCRTFALNKVKNDCPTDKTMTWIADLGYDKLYFKFDENNLYVTSKNNISCFNQTILNYKNRIKDGSLVSLMQECIATPTPTTTAAPCFLRPSGCQNIQTGLDSTGIVFLSGLNSNATMQGRFFAIGPDDINNPTGTWVFYGENQSGRFIDNEYVCFTPPSSYKLNLENYIGIQDGSCYLAKKTTLLSIENPCVRPGVFPNSDYLALYCGPPDTTSPPNTTSTSPPNTTSPPAPKCWSYSHCTDLECVPVWCQAGGYSNKSDCESSLHGNCDPPPNSIECWECVEGSPCNSIFVQPNFEAVPQICENIGYHSSFESCQLSGCTKSTTTTHGPCCPGALTISVTYSNAGGPCPGYHKCNAATFYVKVNDTVLGIADLDNAADGGDRAAGFSIPSELVDGGGGVSFELVCVEGESRAFDIPGCHERVEWVQIFDNGVEIFSDCIQAATVVTASRCSDLSLCPTTTATTPPPDNCTVENCGGFPCFDPVTEKCCGDGVGNCGCCPEITWVCCPGHTYCAASLGDCP